MVKKSSEKLRDVDFKKVQSQLVIRIRGRKSQKKLNQQMNYSFNKVTKWENGTNKISWSDFLKLLDIQKIDIKPYFVKTFGYDGDIRDVSSLIFHITGQIPSDTLATSLGVSRAKVYRMHSSATPFYLEDMLKIIFLADSYFLDFIRMVAGDEPIEELKHFHECAENQDIFFYFPETALILSCLELSEYQESEYQEENESLSFLVQKTGIEESKIKEILAKLEAKGMVEKKNIRYAVLAKVGMLDKDKKKILENKLFWLKKYQNYMDKKLQALKFDDENLNSYGYMVTAVTPEAKKAIKKQISRFYQEIMTILSSDINQENTARGVKKEDVYLLQVGMLSLLKE